MGSGGAGASSEVKLEEGDEQKYPYLISLNAAQLKAVASPPSTPLQILAGPGSGKTRVLTSRVAHLVKYHGYRPMEIVAVTFTNKAAREMGKRLEVLLGKKDADSLILGTFHATCARYLRRYGRLIQLSNNFSVSDADDCKKLMSRLIKEKSDILEAASISLKDSAVLSEISKAKAKGETPDGMAIRATSDPNGSTSTLVHIAELYGEYEAALREANSLDFDDLLVFGLALFKTAPRVLEHCKHILVDEFQDTNTTQYELMRCFAKAHGGMSVVGDPDQSIYGWRSAEVENLNRMAKDFPGTEAIYLEENYRSTGSILSAAHAVVSQDRDRIQKSLFTSHPISTPVSLKTFSTPIIESSFIATEIKRLIAYSGGVLGYDDFAILLRYNALSRTIESTLQKDSIPNRIVGGHKFFERMEIKDLLAYLQLAENPNFTPAFVRVVNTPRRAIGDKSITDLLAAAKSQKTSPMELAERIIDGDQLPAGLKPAIKKNLANFVGVVRKLRRAAEKGTSVPDLLRMIIERTGYEEHLRKTQQDFDSRWENVQELISYSVVVAEEQARETSVNEGEGFMPASSASIEAIINREPKAEEGSETAAKRLHPMFRRTSSESSAGLGLDLKPKIHKKRPRAKNGGEIKEEPIEVASSDDDAPRSGKRVRVNNSEEDAISNTKPKSPGLLNEDPSNQAVTPLTYFLQTSMLSTDTESSDDQAKQPKVTITTVHAAKGLEWPVVFIPAVEQGTFPSYRCTEPDEIAEERRLLYVAMTRAQVFLTLSHCNMRMLGGEDSEKNLSEFINLTIKKNPNTFSSDLPDIDTFTRGTVAAMLSRPPPDEELTKDMIRRHVRAAPPLSMWDAPEPQDGNFNRFARREITKATRAAEYWASDYDEYALPGMSGSGSGRPPANMGGFQSARMAKPDRGSPNGTSPKKPPPRPVKHASMDIPAPLPFTFGVTEDKKPEAGLGQFTNASSNFFANLDSLGVGPGIGTDPGSGGNSPYSPSMSTSPKSANGTSTSPRLNGVERFQSTAAAGMDLWKNLGPPEEIIAPAATSVALAKGTKRLGMGRLAPWGSKR